MCALGDSLAGGMRDHMAGRIARKGRWQVGTSHPFSGDDVDDVSDTRGGQGDSYQVICVIGEVIWGHGTALK